MVKFGLLGEKLSHSLSPKIHELLFRELDIEGTYSLLEIEKGNLATAFARLHENYGGVNVTIPYKTEVMPLLTKISPEAAAIGAVNTICFKDRDAYGYNTDYYGFGFLLRHNGIEVVGKNVAVLGSGGAARAVLQYLSDFGARNVLVVSRNPEHSSEALSGMALKVPVEFCDYASLFNCGRGDVIINCTPLGMFPHVADSPVPQQIAAGFAAAVDLIYNPLETVFLRQAREAGKKTANGLLMLVAQAVAAEEIWLERKIDGNIIIKIAQTISGENQ